MYILTSLRDAYNNVTWISLYLNIMVIFFSIDLSVNNIYRPEDKGNVIREVKEADAIILTFPMYIFFFLEFSVILLEYVLYSN